MDTSAKKPPTVLEDGRPPPSPRLPGLVRKSALLNAVIVLTSSPVLIAEGGAKALAPTLAVMAGISALLWSATFALFSFASLASIFATPLSAPARTGRRQPAEESVLADRWTDGAV